MNVLNISSLELASQSGAVDHFIGVANGLSEVGAKVTIVAPIRGDMTQKLLPQVTSHMVNVQGLGTFEMLAALSKKVLNIVDQNHFDAIYLRTFPLDYYFLVRHLRQRGIKVVCEINTKTGPEYRSKGKALQGWLFEWFEGQTLSHCQGWLPITNEICTYAQNISKSDKPFLIAKNAVDFDQLPDIARTKPRTTVRNELGVSPETFVMVMLGFNRPWHGLDRAVKMLEHMPNTELWLIGSSGPTDDAVVQAAARLSRVEKQVRIFPWMNPAHAASLVAAADLGLSALAIDLKNLSEAQPMKVATYLYLGTPVLTNHRDLRLSTDLPFVLSCLSTDSMQLANVALGLSSSEQLRIQAHQFAQDHLSWRSVGQETLNFLKSIL